MADVFQDRLNETYGILNNRVGNRMDVPENRRFIGFDAHRRAMDCLNEGDVVILTTPPAFRWVHFTYAIEKRLNVFMEKPVTVDGPSSRRMLALNRQAQQHNLKVGVGLMCRHCDARKALHQRLRDDIGEPVLLRAYRMQGPIGSAFTRPRPANSNMSELLYQIRNFHSFLWASGGSFSDFFIHNIDECCWMKNAWPISAKAQGGRHYRGDYVDQNFDSYSVEYTFADGTKLQLEGRNRVGCHQEFASYAHGTRGTAIISRSGHSPARCKTFRGHNMVNDNLIWRFEDQEPDPYQLEWNHLISAIRNNRQHNEVERGVEASLVTAMGRMAAHTGKIITRDRILNSDHEFGQNLPELTMDSQAPLRTGEDGKYPVPRPGLAGFREF